MTRGYWSHWNKEGHPPCYDRRVNFMEGHYSAAEAEARTFWNYVPKWQYKLQSPKPSPGLGDERRWTIWFSNR